MKRFTLYFSLALLVHATSYTQTHITDIDGRLLMGKSDRHNLNINRDLGTLLQDVKRSALFLIFLENDNKTFVEACGGSLLNNISQDGRLLVFTAAHCISPFKVGEEINTYFSFDYELPNATKRGDPEKDKYISVVTAAKATVLLKYYDRFDTALLELSNIEDPSFLEYSFASGWNNSIESIIRSNVSHPNADHKKVFINNSKHNVFSFDAARTLDRKRPNGILDLNGYMFKSGNDWKGSDGMSTFPERGSSGSGIFNPLNQMIAIFNAATKKTSVGMSIANTWLTTDDAPSLQDYLDPNQTWLRSMPGGYRSELIPTNNINPVLTLNPGERYSTPGIDKNDPTKLEKGVLKYSIPFGITKKGARLFSTKTWENYVGVKQKNRVGESKVLLTMNHMGKQNNGQYTEFLLYGILLDKNSPDQPNREFKGHSWDCKNPPPGLPSCPLSNTKSSVDYRNRLLQLAGLKSDQSGKVESVKSSNQFATIRLQNIGTEAVDIQAIGYPGNLPVNALQFFKPEEITYFKSNKYPISRGLQSNDLYIQESSFTQNNYHRTLETENNGGYVNLVNPNFKIGPIRASIPYDVVPRQKLQFDIEVKKKANDLVFSYGVYADYSQSPTDQKYAFNDIASEGASLDENTIQFEYEMPTYKDLGLQPGERKIARVRMSIRKGDKIPKPDKSFQIGEVEDYLIEIVAPTEEEMNKEILNQATIRLTGKVVTTSNQCTTTGNEADVEVVDVNTPDTCNYIEGDCNANGNCESFVIQGDVAQGDNAIDFDGNHVVVIDEGNALIHDTFAERTVTFWIKVDALSNNLQVVYNEGGSDNGFSVGLKDGKLELAVAINGQLKTAISPNAIEIDKWVHVAGVFNNGTFLLYINGEEKGPITGLNTSVPNRTEGATWGGIQGTTPFNLRSEAANNYVGKSDDLQIFPRALRDETIQFLAQQNNSPSLSVKSSSRVATSELSNSQEDTADFSIFPSPAKNELNIIVEIAKEGPLDIGIFDLTGRQVYETKEPSIDQGHQLITLKNLKISAGVYIVKVLVGNVTQSEQVVFE